jgi:hypothetical protein
VNGLCVFALAVALTACGNVAQMATLDGGFDAGSVHRDPKGDWCHCDRGHMPLDQGLACVVDPHATGRTTLDLVGSDTRACWHVENGPFQTVQSAQSVDRLLTVYTMPLRPYSNTLFEGSLSFVAPATSAYVATLSANVAFAVREVFSSSEKDVPILVTFSMQQCGAVSQQFGFELVEGVRYKLLFGPTQLGEATFILDQVQ